MATFSTYKRVLWKKNQLACLSKKNKKRLKCEMESEPPKKNKIMQMIKNVFLKSHEYEKIELLADKKSSN